MKGGKVKNKGRGARGEGRDLTSRFSCLTSFSGPVQAFGPIMNAQPSIYRNSFLHDVIPPSRVTRSTVRFPSLPQIKQKFGDSLVQSCSDVESYCIPEMGSEEMVAEAIPSSWIRSVSKSTANASCPACGGMSAHTPELELHALRHAYAHQGAWASLRPDDRIKIAYAIRNRLASSNRIRFAHAERIVDEAQRIVEYWVELLAFAFGVAAESKTEWRNRFLARAVRRSAGSAYVYPTPETGIADLALVEWYLGQVDLGSPWTYAARSKELMDRIRANDRRERLNHVISGFPHGRLRVAFSALEYESASHTEPLIPWVEVPHTAVVWMEEARLFANRLATVDIQGDEAPFFHDASRLAGEFDRLPMEDRRKTLAVLQQYITSLIHSV